MMSQALQLAKKPHIVIGKTLTELLQKNTTYVDLEKEYSKECTELHEKYILAVIFRSSLISYIVLLEV